MDINKKVLYEDLYAIEKWFGYEILNATDKSAISVDYSRYVNSSYKSQKVFKTYLMRSLLSTTADLLGNVYGITNNTENDYYKQVYNLLSEKITSLNEVYMYYFSTVFGKEYNKKPYYKIEEISDLPNLSPYKGMDMSEDVKKCIFSFIDSLDAKLKADFVEISKLSYGMIEIQEESQEIDEFSVMIDDTKKTIKKSYEPASMERYRNKYLKKPTSETNGTFGTYTAYKEFKKIFDITKARLDKVYNYTSAYGNDVDEDNVGVSILGVKRMYNVLNKKDATQDGETKRKELPVQISNKTIQMLLYLDVIYINALYQIMCEWLNCITSYITPLLMDTNTTE